MKKCKECKGKGIVKYKTRKSLCYYCRGTGKKNVHYGRNQL